MRAKLWPPEEMRYIRDHYLKQTDYQMAEVLNRTENAVRKQRIKQGLFVRAAPQAVAETAKELATVNQDLEAAVREMVDSHKPDPEPEPVAEQQPDPEVLVHDHPDDADDYECSDGECDCERRPTPEEIAEYWKPLVPKQENQASSATRKIAKGPCIEVGVDLTEARQKIQGFMAEHGDDITRIERMLQDMERTAAQPPPAEDKGFLDPHVQYLHGKIDGLTEALNIIAGR